MTQADEVVVDVRDIQRLHLEPGDILIYTYPGKLSDYVADVIRQRMREAFGTDIPVVIIDSGARLQVVNKNELESA